MTNILVTGGAGNVGGALAKKLLENRNNYVVVVDNLLTGNKKNLPTHAEFENFCFIKADVNNYNDISAIFFKFGFDYVFHYAAVVGVQRTLESPIDVLNDIDGIKNILQLSKNSGVKRVFYSSSSEVYGEPVEFPQNEETTPLNSKLPYAIVKNVAEAFLKCYKKAYDLNYTIFRFFNTYGPDQTTDFVILKFIDAAMHNRTISIYGDGSQTRTFCYIDDNIDATIKSFEGDYFTNDVVNIGSDVEISIKELAELVIRLTGSSSQIVYLPPLPEGDMTRRKPDITKMKRLLNRRLYTVEEGIKKILETRYHITSDETNSLITVNN